MKEEKVFLGGTCNGSRWREKIIPMLKIDYFNPVVPDWTPECQEEEKRQKKQIPDVCDYTENERSIQYCGSRGQFQ